MVEGLWCFNFVESFKDGTVGHSITRETIGTVWVPPVVMGNEQAFASKIIGCAGGLAANLRAQILRHGMKGVSTFRRGVRDAVERGGIGEISQEAFCASAGCAGAKLTVSLRTFTAWQPFDLGEHSSKQACQHLLPPDSRVQPSLLHFAGRRNGGGVPLSRPPRHRYDLSGGCSTCCTGRAKRAS